MLLKHNRFPYHTRFQETEKISSYPFGFDLGL